MEKFRHKKKKINIQVGLDFGTSATKIAYAQVGGRFVRAVIFNHGLPNYPIFALPSVLAFDNQGRLLIGIDAARHLLDKSWQEGVQRSKMIVAGKYDHSFREPQTEQAFHQYLEVHKKDPSAYTPERLTAIYLAYAMRVARNALKTTSEYRNYDLDIAFNICMPIDHLENNNVKPVFEKIFAWAEAIESAWPEDDNNADLLELSAGTENSVSFGHPEARVFAIPEAVAEIASYRFSLEKTPGLHAVIDFGAGTTDVSIFNLRDELHEFIDYWYSARNIPWGMIKIGQVIAKMMVSYLKMGNVLSGNTLIKIITSLENTAALSIDGSLKSAMRHQVKAKFLELWGSRDYKERAWGSAYGHLANQLAWERVKVFIGGGGSTAPFVKEVFSVPWCYPTVKGPYSVNPLPKPANYDSVNGQAPFHRMAVAYGLSFPKPLLDGFVLPGDCPDQTPPPLPIWQDYYEDNLI